MLAEKKGLSRTKGKQATSVSANWTAKSVKKAIQYQRPIQRELAFAFSIFFSNDVLLLDPVSGCVNKSTKHQFIFQSLEIQDWFNPTSSKFD